MTIFSRIESMEFNMNSSNSKHSRWQVCQWQLEMYFCKIIWFIYLVFIKRNSLVFFLHLFTNSDRRKVYWIFIALTCKFRHFRKNPCLHHGIMVPRHSPLRWNPENMNNNTICKRNEKRNTYREWIILWKKIYIGKMSKELKIRTIYRRLLFYIHIQDDKKYAFEYEIASWILVKA